MIKPRINVRCVADKYSGPNESIVEFVAGERCGGLISFRYDPESETLIVEPYRMDPGVTVRVGGMDCIP